jgi:hypothetical protein
MSYLKRIIEEDLLDKLSASGAVLIKGSIFFGLVPKKHRSF